MADSVWDDRLCERDFCDVKNLSRISRVGLETQLRDEPMPPAANSLQLLILTAVRDYLCEDAWHADIDGLSWKDNVFICSCVGRLERSDDGVWSEFIRRLKRCRERTRAVEIILRRLGLTVFDQDSCRITCTATPSGQHGKDIKLLLDLLTASRNYNRRRQNQLPKRSRKSRQRIMYIEQKPGLTGHARIGRVLFSQSGRTIYYADRRLRSLDGRGYKANYYNVDSHLEYWITGCRKDGRQTLYGGFIGIDDDAREEYWLRIRQRPDCVKKTSYRCNGKYSKREPR